MAINPFLFPKTARWLEFPGLIILGPAGNYFILVYLEPCSNLNSSAPLTCKTIGHKREPSLQLHFTAHPLPPTLPCNLLLMPPNSLLKPSQMASGPSVDVTNRFFSLLNMCSCLMGSHYVCPLTSGIKWLLVPLSN